MKQTATPGTNVTGIKSAKSRAQEMYQGIQEFGQVPPGADGHELDALREDYAARSGPLGSVPPPSGARKTLKTAAKAIAGKHPTLFLDKLGERLAFERTGVRLYEGLIVKLEAYGSFDGGPSKGDLQHILEEELDHFHMLCEVMDELGGDPTAETPSADLHGNASKGIGDVIGDPRVSFLQSLEAILLAELADNAGWEVLRELAEMAGEDETARRFELAERVEADHLEKVQAWLAAGQARTQPGEARVH